MKNRKKETPATITQLAAAMKALGAYAGENTDKEHEREAERLGAGKDYYRTRLANALLGIVETEAMLSEGSGGSDELMLHAHQQALEAAGAMDSIEKLLGFLRWRTLRIEGPLKLIAQDKGTGPIPLAAAHSAEALQQLLGFCVNDQHTNPATLDPATITSELKRARESLTNAVANIDIMFDLLAQAEEYVSRQRTQNTGPGEAPPQSQNNRVQRASKLLLLEMYVPVCVERGTTDFFIPPVDWALFQKQAQEWGIWRMSEREFSQFEEKKMEEFTKSLSAVSPVFPLKVFSLVDNLIGVTAKTVGSAEKTSDLPRISKLLAGMGQTREKLIALARRIEPEMINSFTTTPPRNPLEALLLMADELLNKLRAAKFPVPDDVRFELARFLAENFTFSSAWPFTHKQIQAAMTPGHPELRPDIPDEYILVVAREAEKLLISKLEEEGVKFSDATQAGMTVVYLTVETLFGKSKVSGGDAHETYHIASVLVRSFKFSPAFPYSTEEISKALRAHFRLQP